MVSETERRVSNGPMPPLKIPIHARQWDVQRSATNCPLNFGMASVDALYNGFDAASVDKAHSKMKEFQAGLPPAKMGLLRSG